MTESALAYTTSTGEEPVSKITKATVVPTDPALQPTKRIVKKATKKRAPRVNARATDTHAVKVDPRVMAAAKTAMRPGQRLVIVDAECVRLVNA